MEQLPKFSEIITTTDVFFLLMGAILIFAMHAGFAFLEVGTVRRKNQVNGLVKILCDWSLSTVMYFFIGFPIAYGMHFFHSAASLSASHGYELVRFFFLLCFAACIPAIISGGIAERMKFWSHFLAGAVLVALVYPAFESIIWGQYSDVFQGWLKNHFGFPFHDYAGSVVVHSIGGWLALPAVLLLGPRKGRYTPTGPKPIPISNIPFLALGSWFLCIGWFGFNVMSAQHVMNISGLVALNSLLAMVGGVLFALVFSQNDPGFIHNGALAGLIAICAGSDIVHPIGAFFIGGVASLIFIYGFSIEQEHLKIDDVLGVWPLHGLTGTWGGIAAGIFGSKVLGGIGNVSFISQVTGSVLALVYALVCSWIIYSIIKAIMGLRLDIEEEVQGSDISIHHITAYPEEDM